MGKGILIFVMASTVSLTTLYLARTEQELATVQTEVDYQEKMLAQQTAQSAFNIVISKVRQSFESESFVLKDQSYGGASYDIGAIRDDGSVTLIAVGKYGRHSFEIIGSMVMQGEEINEAISISGEDIEIEMKKNAVISGIDANPDGEDVDAVTVPDASAFEDHMDHLEGGLVLGDPSSLTSAIESAILSSATIVKHDDQEWHTNKRKNENIGSPTSPEIVVVYDDVELKGDFEGYGVLYVDGDLKMDEGTKWYGIVFVTGSDNEMEMKNGAEVEGVLFLDGIEELEMKNASRVQYNSAALDMLQPLLDLLDSEGQAEVIRQVANTSYKDGQEMGNAYIDNSVAEARNLLN
jgi:hypothetical protein